MEMAKYIMQILRTQPMIVFSWGFHTPVAINNGLKFKVQGYLHKGWVELSIMKEETCLRLEPSTGTEQSRNKLKTFISILSSM